MRILMVCLGNICRSPLAEGIMYNKIKKNNLNWQVESVGTGNSTIGHPAHYLSEKVARLHGVDISRHRARQFKKEDMIDFDKIYVMDIDNYNDVKKMSCELWNATKIDLLMNEKYPGENINIPDPWYSEEPAFYTVYKMIDEACESIIEKYVTAELSIVLSEQQQAFKVS